MRFGVHLVREGIITSEQLYDAVAPQAAQRPQLG